MCLEGIIHSIIYSMILIRLPLTRIFFPGDALSHLVNGRREGEKLVPLRKIFPMFDCPVQSVPPVSRS